MPAPSPIRSAARLLLFAAGLLLSAAQPVRADIFDDLSGTFGYPDVVGLRCHENPHTVTFPPDRSRATFRWRTEMIDYLDQPRLSGTYVVQRHDAESVTMAITDEQRLTDEGVPVVWVMRRVSEPDGYCWGRTDWPATRCESRHVRCPAAAATS